MVAPCGIIKIYIVKVRKEKGGDNMENIYIKIDDYAFRQTELKNIIPAKYAGSEFHALQSNFLDLIQYFIALLKFLLLYSVNARL